MYIHAGRCGGEIDTRFFGGRKCLKCGKRWTLLTFMFDLRSIRPVKVRVPYEPARTKYAKWADNPKVAFIGAFAERLPNWPRWARILSTLTFVGLVGILVWVIWIRG